MRVNPINRLYTGLMDVYVFEKQGNGFGEVLRYQNKRCALSAITSRLLNGTIFKEDSGARLENIRMKVFCDPDYAIPSGSVLHVTQNGQQWQFTYTGTSLIYPTHQELMVEVRKYA